MENCITAFSLERGLFWYIFFGYIVDFGEDFAEKGRKIKKLCKFFSRYYSSYCQRFLVLGIKDTVVICKVTFNINHFVYVFNG